MILDPEAHDGLHVPFPGTPGANCIIESLFHFPPEHWIPFGRVLQNWDQKVIHKRDVQNLEDFVQQLALQSRGVGSKVVHQHVRSKDSRAWLSAPP